MDVLAAVRQLADAIIAGERDAIMAFMHPEVDWMPPSGVFGPPPHQAVYVGRDEVEQWMEILPRLDYVPRYSTFEAVGGGVLAPCDLEYHDGRRLRVFVTLVFDQGLVRDGRTFASDAAARAWLESL